MLLPSLTVVLGNVYPVIEHPHKPGSLSGTMLKSGYSSHYVATTSSGIVAGSSNKKTYDEIIVNQEVQVRPFTFFLFRFLYRITYKVCPAFILELKNANFSQLIKEFNREIAKPPDSEHSDTEIFIINEDSDNPLLNFEGNL